MTTRIRQAWAPLAMFSLGIAACSSEKKAAPAASGGTAPVVSAGSPKAEPPSAAWEALTRQKFRDEEFASAIATLEPASGATDAGNDVGGGLKRLLGIRQPTGWYKVPGINVPREKLEGVSIVSIDGIVDGSDNPHHMRYQMLAEKYAKDYNGVMIRVIR